MRTSVRRRSARVVRREGARPTIRPRGSARGRRRTSSRLQVNDLAARPGWKKECQRHRSDAGKRECTYLQASRGGVRGLLVGSGAVGKALLAQSQALKVLGRYGSPGRGRQRIAGLASNVLLLVEDPVVGALADRKHTCGLESTAIPTDDVVACRLAQVDVGGE